MVTEGRESRQELSPANLPVKSEAAEGMGWLSALSAWAAPEPHRAAPRSKQLQRDRGSQAGAGQRQVGIHLAKHGPGPGGRAALQGQFFL